MKLFSTIFICLYMFSVVGAEIFLKIEGIEGSSTFRGHEREIPIDSFTFGADNVAATGSGGGNVAGKVKVSEIVITKKLDKSSPVLFSSTANGKHFPNATLTVVKPGTLPSIEKIDLGNVAITSYSQSVSDSKIGGLEALEKIALSYSRIAIGVTDQDQGRVVNPPVVICFDVATNKNC